MPKRKNIRGMGRGNTGGRGQNPMAMMQMLCRAMSRGYRGGYRGRGGGYGRGRGRGGGDGASTTGSTGQTNPQGKEKDF